MLAAPTLAASANLVQDGEFSNPPLSSGDATYFAPNLFGAWLVTQGSVDQISASFWEAPPGGGLSVDLDGYYQAGGLSQALSLTSGKTYTLSFYLSGNGAAGDPAKTVRSSATSRSRSQRPRPGR